MTDNSVKVSQLPVTTNVASTDRILILKNAEGVPSVRTITVNNFNNTAFVTTSAAHWANPAPTTIAEALDRLAVVVKALNGGTGA